MPEGTEKPGGEVDEQLRRAVNLLQTSEGLRKQTEELREESAKLREQFLAMRATAQADRRVRLAALNLMEETEEARRRSEREASERERAEATLRQGEEQFRRAIEQAPIPVIMYTEDGEVLQISRAWAELTGFRPDDMPRLERWLREVQAPGTEAVLEGMRAVFRGSSRSEEMEFEILTQKRETRYWLFTTSTPGTLRDGRRFGVGMAVDITERKRAEQALARSEERLRMIVENVREYAIFTTDLQRRVTSWNPGAEQILGFTEEEILGRSADIIFTDEDQAAGACETEVKTALERGRAADERWHQRKDRSRFWGSGVMMLMHSAANQIIGFVKVLRDQTAAKRADEALAASRAELELALKEAEHAREDAERANKTKDTFLAALSHELRTPLTPVLMTAESLLKSKELAPRLREGLEMIRRNVELETHFINDLLDLTRISRGKFELLREPVDLHEVIRQAVEICETDIKQKEQTLNLVLRAGQAGVLGDSRRLQQVFWNVLKNASKFTAERGAIEVLSSNEAGQIVVAVRDNGIGISRGQLDSIFEAFTQAGPEIAQRYGGLGLGLAISRATVEQLGGSIRADSDGVGAGAVFTIRLPLLTEAANPTA